MEDEVGAGAGGDHLGVGLEAADGLGEAVSQEGHVDEEAEALDLLNHDRRREQRGRHCNDMSVYPYFGILATLPLRLHFTEPYHWWLSLLIGHYSQLPSPCRQ